MTDGGLTGFADLIDALSFAGGRNAKLKLMADWLRAAPDPDRGWGLAALTGALDLPAVKPALIRALIEERVDPELFRLSYDYVGDLAETVSLLWDGEGADRPGLAAVVDRLRTLGRAEAPAALAALMDGLDASGRFALLKLATGNLRVGAGARLARLAFAQAFGVAVEEVEELWHGLEPPYAGLFAWGEGRGERPDLSARPLFRPFMLAHPLEEPEALDVAAFAAEWWPHNNSGHTDEAMCSNRCGRRVSAAIPYFTTVRAKAIRAAGARIACCSCSDRGCRNRPLPGTSLESWHRHRRP